MINVVTSLAEAGEAMVIHPAIDKISFTGWPSAIPSTPPPTSVR
ncbi:hypothetical protein [Actinomadura physcomitrii]|nr:hypothetical protein [Actinomadura physcomitrii]